MTIEIVKSDIVYQGRAFDVRRDQIRLPGGRVTDLDIIDHPGAVTILPIDDDGQIWFIRQYRHSAGRVILELPAGTLEPDEAPEVCAHRETREEIGMAAKRMLKIGEFFLAPGYSTEYMYIYLAGGLYPAPLDSDEDEIITIEKVPVTQVYSLIEKGQLMDGKSLAALFLARDYLSAQTVA